MSYPLEEHVGWAEEDSGSVDAEAGLRRWMSKVLRNIGVLPTLRLTRQIN